MQTNLLILTMACCARASRLCSPAPRCLPAPLPPLSVTPRAGPATGGFQVTINGLVGTLVAATFGATAATIVSTSPRSGRAVVVAPPNVPGVVDLVLITSKPSQTQVLKFVYTQATWRGFVTKINPLTDPYSVLEINPVTNAIVGRFALPLGMGALGSAVTPDGSTLVVLGVSEPRVFHISLVTGQIVADFSLMGLTTLTVNQLTSITMDPRGRWYAIGTSPVPQVVVLSLASPGRVLAQIPTSGFAFPTGLGTTPNGQILLAAAANDATFIINTSTWQITTTLPDPAGSGALGIAPDGKLAYLTTNASQIKVLNLASMAVVQTIATPGFTSSAMFTITPDGKWGYTNLDAQLGVVDLKNARFLGTVVLPSPSGAASVPSSASVTITANDSATGRNINKLLVATQTIVSSTQTNGNNASSVVITSDPSPLAEFTARKLGATTYTFDASQSLAPIGAIASYAWDFGDGTPEVETKVPTVTHTYTAPNDASGSRKRTVTLTVTTTGGTSTEQVWSTVMMSNNGGPSARAVQVLTLAKPGGGGRGRRNGCGARRRHRQRRRN